MQKNTVFALSSGSLPSGTAVVRISGPSAFSLFPIIVRKQPVVRTATLVNIYHPSSSDVLDKGIVITFHKGHSFTGEDIVELHCHGGVATVDAVLSALSELPDFRPAEAGEFSRRAFESGKLDLTELEGLSDLIAAQTDGQRKLALAQSSGKLRKLYEGWREDLVRNRAFVEAEFDFSDEDDVPGSVSDQVWEKVRSLQKAIEDHLFDNRRGEIIREGFKIALLGPPNAGKSSLLNALAQRDVAIVTDQPGTTRDVIELQLNIADQLVIVSDTAGLRETDDIVEREGVKRSNLKAEEADLILWLQASDQPLSVCPFDHAVMVWTKSDIGLPDLRKNWLTINTNSNDGLSDLLAFLQKRLQSLVLSQTDIPMTRARHRTSLLEVTDELSRSLQNDLDGVVRSEHLRLAADALGRITGRIDVEDLLDVIFSEFCIGK